MQRLLDSETGQTLKGKYVDITSEDLKNPLRFRVGVPTFRLVLGSATSQEAMDKLISQEELERTRQQRGGSFYSVMEKVVDNSDPFSQLGNIPLPDPVNRGYIHEQDLRRAFPKISASLDQLRK